MSLPYPQICYVQRGNALLVGSLLLTLAVPHHTSLAQSPSDGPPQAARRLTGIVTDTATRPIPDAEVSSLGGVGAERATRTQADGRFVLGPLAPGPYVVQVRRLGYQTVTFPITLSDHAPGDLEITLGQTPAMLPALAVREETHAARPNTLEGRMASGFGQFRTRQQITDMNATSLADIVRKGIRGFKVDRAKDNHLVLKSARGEESMYRPCFPEIWVDGIHADRSVFDQIPASDVEAVEAYTGGATVPVELGGTMASCGVFVIWTKAGPIKSP